MQCTGTWSQQLARNMEERRKQYTTPLEVPPDRLITNHNPPLWMTFKILQTGLWKVLRFLCCWTLLLLLLLHYLRWRWWVHTHSLCHACIDFLWYWRPWTGFQRCLLSVSFLTSRFFNMYRHMLTRLSLFSLLITWCSRCNLPITATISL